MKQFKPGDRVMMHGLSSALKDIEGLKGTVSSRRDVNGYISIEPDIVPEHSPTYSVKPEQLTRLVRKIKKPKFKVGDTVELIGKDSFETPVDNLVGNITNSPYTHLVPDQDGDYRVTSDGRVYYVKPHNMSLLVPAQAMPNPVGSFDMLDLQKEVEKGWEKYHEKIEAIPDLNRPKEHQTALQALKEAIRLFSVEGKHKTAKALEYVLGLLEEK